MTIADSSLLLFQVGPVPCCVDSNTVQIVIEPPAHITAIPGSNAYRPGLMVYAKRAVSVYDVRTKFNLSTEQRGKIILTEIDNKMFGFWVDRIQSITLASEGKWQTLPTECPKDLFEAVFMYNKQLIFKTNFNALAKAQVSTQTQHFINKLLQEEKQEAKASTSIKDTARLKTKTTIETTENDDKQSTTPLKQEKLINTKSITNTFEKPNTHLKTPIIKTSGNINKTNEHHSPQTREPINNSPMPASQHRASAIKKKTESLTPHTKTTTPPLSSKAIKHKESFSKNTPTQRKFNIPTEKIPTENITPALELKNINKKLEQQSVLSGILFLMVFIVGIAGLSWYLFFDTRSINTSQSNQVSKSQTTKKDKTITSYEKRTLSTLPTETIRLEVNTEDKIILDNSTTTESYKKTTDDDIVEERKTDSAYISHADNTITITIDNFDTEFNKNILKKEENLLQPGPVENITTADLTLDSNEKTLSVRIELENTDPQTTDQLKALTSITTHRIIHTIVKGDTLWHIAKRYIHDPFKYPQLARLSKIKNPDLIYPGNNVIIVIKNHKTK